MDLQTSILRAARAANPEGDATGLHQHPDPSLLNKPDTPAEAPIWQLELTPVNNPERQLHLNVQSVLTLGRGNSATAFISLDPHGAHRLGVSRRHVIMRASPGGVYISDLGSRNGSRLNGHPLRAFTFYRLRNRDRLALGLLEFLVRMDDGPIG